MAVVVIGGHSRNVGKTSLVAGLIAALPEREWLAIKITQFGHGVCSVNGEACGCAVDEHAFAIAEEQHRSGTSDTSRFLVAGARRALWVRTKQGQLALAMPDLRRELESAGDVIIESNSVIRFLRPDIYLSVLDPATADFKSSAREFLDRASALVMHERAAGATWNDVSLRPAAAKPVFYIRPPHYCTTAIVAFVRQHL